MLQAKGDDAPVIEVVGLGVVSEGMEAAGGDPEASKDHKKREGIGTAVLRALDGRSRVKVADFWQDISSEFQKAGVANAATRQRTVELTTTALTRGGIHLQYDGRAVHLWAGREEASEKAPWWIYATVDEQAEAAPLRTDAGDASNANGSVFA
jgi:hypothetical protein